MVIHFLLEEPSAEAALRYLVPRIVKEEIVSEFFTFVGKQTLLKNLPNRLRGYARGLQQDQRLVVLVDRDRDDCLELKRTLENSAACASLVTKGSAQPGQFTQVLNRIAVEELESWFFGDVPALKAAYPRIPASLGKQSEYRNPDAIAGGTWETLERVLQSFRYYPGGLPKIEAAEKIARYMDPERNTSRSFQVFRDGLRALAAP